MRSASHLFSFTAVSADGTLPRSTSRSKSRPASRVRVVLTFIIFYWVLTRLRVTVTYHPLQLNCRSLRTRRPTRSNSSVLKNTLSLSYVHPLLPLPPPPPTSLATHTQRTLTLRRPMLLQPRRRLHWRVIFQASESTPLLRAAGATRAHGMRFPSITAVLRLRAPRMAPAWSSCGA